MKGNFWYLIVLIIFLCSGCNRTINTSVVASNYVVSDVKQSLIKPTNTSTVEAPIYVVSDVKQHSIEPTNSPTVNVAIRIPEKYETPVVVPKNPYANIIWDQYCKKIREGGMVVDKKCDETWAMEPLPGGCEAQIFNYKGFSGCTAASLAYVINAMLSPIEINQVVGGERYGVTPAYLIDETFPKKGIGVKLGCNGTSSSTIKDTLEYFGLKTRTVAVSKNTLAANVGSDEIAIVGIAANYEGEYLEHWTVFVRKEGKKLIFADSYLGRGHEVVFDELPDVRDWEIISLLIVSKTPLK